MDEDTETEGDEKSARVNTEELYPAIQRARSQLAASQAQFSEAIEKMLEPIREQHRELAQTLHEYYEEVQTAVESTIDLEEPWEYDPNTSSVHVRAQTVAANYTLDLVDKLQEIDDPYFTPIQHRMQVGVEAYKGRLPNREGDLVDVQPRPHEAIFIFISLQDSLMHWLC